MEETNNNQEEKVCRPCSEKSKIIEGNLVAGQINYSVRDKVNNLVSGIGDMLKENYVSNEEYMRRKEICRQCPHRLNVLTNKHNLERVSKADKCMACDCFLIAKVGNLRGKCWLVNQECPLGKWKK